MCLEPGADNRSGGIGKIVEQNDIAVIELARILKVDAAAMMWIMIFNRDVSAAE